MDETPLERRQRRVKTIRTRIAAGAAALFIAVFGGLTVQLASGHDPALSTTSSKAGVTTTTSQPQSTASSVPSTGGDSSSGSTDQSSSGQSSSGLGPVTTSQS
jgi:hypothetical protein